jgi:ferritin-like metal-binding protein YciE
MAKHAKDLKDLFHETLKDIYFAEKQILRALPKLAKAVQSDELRQAFETHRDETAAARVMCTRWAPG